MIISALNTCVLEYYKDGQITISYYTENSEVNIQCTGFASSPQYRTALKKVLEVLEDKNLSKLMVDTTAMKMIGADDQRWTIRYFLPKALKIGCKAAAIIPSTDYFNRLSIDIILEGISDPLCPIKVTTDTEEARQWLEKI